MAPAKLQPALLGGAFIGVLSALPVVNVANCCCLWLIAGGVLAAYLMQQNHPAPVTPGDGALVGLLAALVGAVVYVLVAAPINLMMGPMVEGLTERLLEGSADMPVEVRELLEQVGDRGAAGIGIAIGFVMNLFLGMVFSTLGGLLGAILFRKPSPPLEPPPLPPDFAPPAGPSVV